MSEKKTQWHPLFAHLLATLIGDYYDLRGKAWGHPVFLVSYRDVPVEEDTIPLHLLDRDPGAPRELGEVVASSEALARRFAAWLRALQPNVWEEIKHMASTSTVPRIFEWEKMAQEDVCDAIRVLPPEKVLDALLTQVPFEQLQEMLRRRQPPPAEGPQMEEKAP